MTKPYMDPTTGQWVGEHETRLPDGEVRRDTEWFDTKKQARRFARTGWGKPEPVRSLDPDDTTDMTIQGMPGGGFLISMDG